MQRNQHNLYTNTIGLHKLNGKGLVSVALTLIAFSSPFAAQAQSDAASQPPVAQDSVAQPSEPETGTASSALLEAKLAAAVTTPIPRPQAIVSEVFNGTIVRIVGDRSLIIHRDDKNVDETVLLYGIKTLDRLAPDGSSAHAYLSQHLKNAKVRIEGRSRNSSGVLFAIVTPIPPGVSRTTQTLIPSGTSDNFPYGIDTAPGAPQTAASLNYTLIRIGLARYNTSEAVNVDNLPAAEASARKDKKGYWALTPDITPSAPSGDAVGATTNVP